MTNLTKQRSWVLQLNNECHPSWGELETFPSGTESGQTLVWDSEKGEWVVGTVAQATETQVGVARIATAAEVEAGVDDETIITPAKLAGAISDKPDRSEIPALASGAGMPSGRKISISMPPNNGTYTAPADGYISVGMTASAANQHLILSSNAVQVRADSWGVHSSDMFLPVKKGSVVSFGYTFGGGVSFCNFVYAQGVPA